MKYKINDIADIISGGTPSTKVNDYWNGNINWVTPKDLSLLKSKRIYQTESTITELGIINSSTKIFPKNSVILSSRAPVGYVAINDNDMCSNQGIKAIVCNKSIVDYNYLYYLLKINIKNLESKASGSTFKELSTNSLKTFEIELPKLEIQKHISNISELLHS